MSTPKDASKRSRIAACVKPVALPDFVQFTDDGKVMLDAEKVMAWMKGEARGEPRSFQELGIAVSVLVLFGADNSRGISVRDDRLALDDAIVLAAGYGVSPGEQEIALRFGACEGWL